MDEKDSLSTTPIMERRPLLEKVIGALVLGWLLGLSNPGFGAWWTAWFAIAPLLVLLRSSKSWSDAAIIGFSFGFAYNFLTLSWLCGFHPAGFNSTQASLLSGLILIVDALGTALCLAVFAILAYALPMRYGFFPHHTRPYFPYILSIPALWIFFEYLAERITGVRLNELACSQAGHIQFVQMARMGGSQLVDFVLVMSNAGLAQLFMSSGKSVRQLAERTDRLLPVTGSLVDVMTIVLIVTFCSLIGARQLSGSTVGCLNKSIPAIPICVLQGGENYAISTGTPVADPSLYATYRSMAKNTDARLIVLPEGVLNYGANSSAVFESEIELHVLSQKQEIISGKIIADNGRTISSARSLPGKGVIYMHTHPSHLLSLMKLPSQLVRVYAPLACALNQNYLEQLPCASTQVIDTSWGAVGISTGLALAWPPLIADEVQHGAGLLVCMLDLSCFRSVVLDKQVLAAAVLRAVENGRYLILSTNRGISAIIDPCGRIVVRSNSCTKCALTSQVQFIYRKTLFSRTRWL